MSMTINGLWMLVFVETLPLKLEVLKGWSKLTHTENSNNCNSFFTPAGELEKQIEKEWMGTWPLQNTCQPPAATSPPTLSTDNCSISHIFQKIPRSVRRTGNSHPGWPLSTSLGGWVPSGNCSISSPGSPDSHLVPSAVTSGLWPAVSENKVEMSEQQG